MVNLTDAYPGYAGKREILVSYVMADFLITKNVRLIGGLRHEDTSIEVNRSQLEIERKTSDFPDLSPTRELQGQSSSIFNLNASWEHYRRGTGVTLSYNNTGERLNAVTNAALPSGGAGFVFAMQAQVRIILL